MVAFVVGGIGNGNTELYSPYGNCSYLLAKIPSSYADVDWPVLGILDQSILSCDNQFNGYQNCWTYNINNNTWSLYTTSNFVHRGPGIIYSGKLYIVDNVNPEVFDPVAQKWSSWPAISTDPRSTCLVASGDQVKTFFY